MSDARDPIAERKRELERRLAALSAEKRALVEQGATTLAADRTAAAAQPTIPRRGAGVPVPMSFAQELFWRLELASPGHAYNVPRVARLQGPLDLAALGRALDALVARHETLRTTFTEVNGEPRQIVHVPRHVPLDIVDLSASTDVEGDAVRRVRDITRRPFDLAHDLQLRATVVKLGAEDHVLVLESHHVVSDAMSRGIVLRELSALYRAERTGAPAELAPLPVQYGDFACWQRAEAAGGRLATQLDYWRKQLAGVPPLDLPTDHPRGAVPSFEGATRSLAFPHELQQAVRQLSETNGVTTFMTVLAAFDVLLARYSGQDDIVVGSPITGRTQPEVEGIVGCFLNTLVLRTSVAGDPTFRELVSRVRDTALGAFEHQEVPYEKLVLDLHDHGRTGREPLYNVGFSFHDPDARPLALEGTTLVPFGADRGATKSDLTLNVSDSARGLRASIAYRTELFDEDTVDRMLAHLGELLASAARTPGEPVSRLNMLGGDERQKVIAEWNRTALAYDESATLALLFQQQVASAPDAPAVTFGAETVSYRKLDERVARLTAYLQQRGVTEDAVVALYVERSIDMVVAMLAIHRAGAAYLPLDPSYPQDRLEFMLADSGARVVITEEALKTSLPMASATVVSLDGDRTAIGDVRDTPKVVANNAERVAYLIYTSGSTGKPKGVAVTQRNVVNFLAGLRSDIPLRGGDVFVSVTPLSFDISALEIFHPLTSGARVNVASRETALDPIALSALLDSANATHLQATPSTWRMLVDAGWPGRRGLIALCGGEALPPALATALLARGLVLWNMYGPTEATIWATMHRVGADDVGADAAQGAALPIGKPMANVQAYVLDVAGEPAPIGVSGELYLGGDGIARGYHDRPELTRERFVPDAFVAASGRRLYRTGDRARWRADGVLQFLGRLDHQVKLRGHRIEMGEIEHALAQLPGVTAAAALVREDVPGDARLVAYLVTAGAVGTDALVSDADSVAAWRGALARELPDYMVPQTFVRLARFPLTPNGKLDRKALPVPPAESASVAQSYEAPRSPIEQRLASIWEEVLRRRPIGVHDEFFAIGGHSLLALRVIARIADVEGIRLPLRAMFEAPTIAALAPRLEAAVRAGEPARETIPRRGLTTAPMSPAQEILWLVQRSTPDLSAYNMVDQWRIEGMLDPMALHEALELLLARHEVFRTTFSAHEGRHAQHVHESRGISLEIVDVSGDADPESAADIAARRAGAAPFDLAVDTLLRPTLIRVRPDSHRLVLVSHHIVYDGWSRGVVQRELSAAYGAIRGGNAPALPALPISYADYSAWQHDRLKGAERDRQLAYWTQRLRGRTMAIDLPTDRPRSGSLSFAGGRRTMVFDRQLLDRLQALARGHDTTLYAVLLAAFQTLLHRYSGQGDVVVGTVVAGRPRRELEDLVGYFVNTLALNAEFEDDPTFSTLVSRVHSGFLEASENADVPFEHVAEALGRAAGATVAPSCQVMFTLQNNADASLALGDARLRRARVDTDTAKFDLFLSMGEQADGLRATLQYRSDLFDAVTIERMLGHLQMLLTSAAAHPEMPVARLPMLTAPEEHRLLVEWNDTDASWPHDATLHGLFEEQAARRPGAIAVVCEDEQLTYGELDRRANRIAWRLRARGAKPDSLVAVCMEKSADVVTVMLGILKAGAAYVPVDPAYPDDRIAFTLEDSECAIVITESELVPRLGAFASTPVIASDLWADGPDARDEAPPASAGPGNLCYVIYTSGSTGRPKGVLIEHRNVVRLLKNSRFQFEFSERDVWTVFHSFAFDFSVWEMYGALLFGGRVIVVPRQLAQQPSEYLALLERHQVTVLNQVPSAFYALMQEALARPRRPLALRYVIFGGEALQPALLKDWKARYPDATLVNMFGITETTVHVTFKVIGDAEIEMGTSNIGRPIPTLTTYVLDDLLQLVPVGVRGELCVGGAGVARGYLKRAELTAERFVPHPFRQGESMYRSGDVGRMRSNGEIEYLGRRDAQVKLRGFRIELGEIEAVLSAQPAVRECVVMAREDVPGDKRLVAYFTVRDGDSVSPADLRHVLLARLPEYMVPTFILPLDAMPTTASGKVDRKLLPAPTSAVIEVQRPYVEPQTEMERKVAAIWAEVLGLDRVGTDRDFFELGGHSLSAMRIVSRVSEVLGATLPLTLVFERPTVAQMALEVSSRAPSDGTSQGIARVARTGQRRPAARSDGGTR